MHALCRHLRARTARGDHQRIYTREDAEFLTPAGRCRTSASGPSKPADVLTRPSARTPRSTSWRRGDDRRFLVRPDPHRKWRGQPRRQVQPRARRLHDLRHRRVWRRQDPPARAAPELPANSTRRSSTKSISRRWSAPTSASCRATQPECGVSAHSYSPICGPGSAFRRSPDSSRATAAWNPNCAECGTGRHPPTRRIRHAMNFGGDGVFAYDQGTHRSEMSRCRASCVPPSHSWVRYTAPTAARRSSSGSARCCARRTATVRGLSSFPNWR